MQTVMDMLFAKDRAVGYAEGYAKGYANGYAKGQANLLMALMNEGMITPAKARAKLMEMRKRSPVEEKAADEVLAIIGNKE